MLGAIMLGTQLGWVIVLGLLALAVAALAPVSWSIVLRVLVVAFLMAGFGAAPALLKGLETPFRGMLFAWVLLVGVCALVVRDSPRFGRRLVFQLVLYGAVAIGVVWWNKPYRLDLPPFQAMSADLADRVDAVGQGRAEVLVIGGQVHAIREMTAVQFSVGLQFRLQSLRQWSVAICDAQAEDALLLVRARSKIDKSDPKIEDTAWRSVYETYAATCADHMEALRALPVYPAEGSLALIAPGVVGLNLPPLRLADQPP
jgi:hypothetical protein